MKAPRLVVTCSLALFASLGGARVRAAPAAKTACQILPAAQASKIIGQTVTERVMETPATPGAVCMYSAERPVLQLGITTYATADLAAKNLKRGATKKTAARQKGNVIVSAVTMNGDASKLDAVLDAALQNL